MYFFFFFFFTFFSQFDLFAAVGRWNVSPLHLLLTPIHCTDPLLLCTLKHCNLFHFTALCPLLYFTEFTINILVKAGLILYQRTGKGPHLIFFNMVRGNRLSCKQAIPSFFSSCQAQAWLIFQLLFRSQAQPSSDLNCCFEPKPSPAQILDLQPSQARA